MFVSRAAGAVRQSFPAFIGWIRYVAYASYGVDLLFRIEVGHGPPFR